MGSLVDPSYELADPCPDVHSLFLEYNARFFDGALAGCEVKWSPRMTTCAGVCSYEGRGGLCSIRLSTPLLKLRPRKDLVETLLHEMIHAFLFVKVRDRDRDGHGPQFQWHMKRINKEAGTNITIYHSFHREVAEYKTHHWRCEGPCRDRHPFYGWVKRASNRAPSKNDLWWGDHQRNCGGTFVKVKEPEDYGKKKSGKEKRVEGKVKENKIAKGQTTIDGYMVREGGKMGGEEKKKSGGGGGIRLGGEAKESRLVRELEGGASTSQATVPSGPGQRLGGGSTAGRSRLLDMFGGGEEGGKTKREEQEIQVVHVKRGTERMGGEKDDFVEVEVVDVVTPPKRYRGGLLGGAPPKSVEASKDGQVTSTTRDSGAERRTPILRDVSLRDAVVNLRREGGEESGEEEEEGPGKENYVDRSLAFDMALPDMDDMDEEFDDDGRPISTTGYAAFHGEPMEAAHLTGMENAIAELEAMEKTNGSPAVVGPRARTVSQTENEGGMGERKEVEEYRTKEEIEERIGYLLAHESDSLELHDLLDRQTLIEKEDAGAGAMARAPPRTSGVRMLDEKREGSRGGGGTSEKRVEYRTEEEMEERIQYLIATGSAPVELNELLDRQMEADLSAARAVAEKDAGLARRSSSSQSAAMNRTVVEEVYANTAEEEEEWMERDAETLREIEEESVEELPKELVNATMTVYEPRTEDFATWFRLPKEERHKKGKSKRILVGQNERRVLPPLGDRWYREIRDKWEVAKRRDREEMEKEKLATLRRSSLLSTSLAGLSTSSPRACSSSSTAAAVPPVRARYACPHNQWPGPSRSTVPPARPPYTSYTSRAFFTPPIRTPPATHSTSRVVVPGENVTIRVARNVVMTQGVPPTTSQAADRPLPKDRNC